MGLLDGKVCLKYNCHRCCLNTEMPLTPGDIKRIVGLGYKLEDFAEFRNGLWRLKNIDGHCVFLKNGKCSIYEYRPTGCRLYPVIEVDDHCEVDWEVCPYASLIDPEEFVVACEKIKKLNRELDLYYGDESYGYIAANT